MSTSMPPLLTGPPYPPPYAPFGGRPSVVPDIPISAVLLPFYITGAALNMYILQTNLRRGHKFIISGAVFGFCMTRIVALVMRIVWSKYNTNIKIGIAANVFTNAGVIIFFVVNFILAQRILRAHHPEFGWRRELRFLLIFIYFSFFACLVLLITSIVYSTFTLDQGLTSQLREIRLFASTYLAVLAFLPIPIVVGAILIPHPGPVDNFGKKGRMRTRVFLVLFTATLLCIGATFRAGVGYSRQPYSNPGWFNHKAAFYCFNFVIEIIVLYTYTLSRFDLRFHIPDGSSAPGHYSQGGPERKATMSEPYSSEADAADVEARGSTEAERERRWEHQLDNELPQRDYDMAESR